MKKKNLILSLIFPIICAVGATVLLLMNIDSPIALLRVMTVVMEVCAIFPLVSVIFMKTDISRLIKWQIISTAAAAGSLLLYILLAGVDVKFQAETFGFVITEWVGNFVFSFLVPVGIILACVAIYTVKVCKESGRRVLKWFTVFFSTPAVYYGMYCLTRIILMVLMILSFIVQ